MTVLLPICLAFEASAGRATVAVARGGAILAMTEVNTAHGHAAWIITLAADALAKAGLGFNDVSTVIAGRGPGSFTGIRVALAAAKGLGLALNLKPIGLSSLAAMARHDSDGRQPVISIINSRRKSLYMQGFSSDMMAVGDIIDGQIDDVIVLARQFCPAGHGNIIINGHDAEQLAEQMTAKGIAVEVGHGVSPSAADLCHYHHDNVSINDGLEPLYLAPPLITIAMPR